MSMEFIPFLLFLVTFLVLLAGYPVAISLAGVAIIFAGFGIWTGAFNQRPWLYSRTLVWGRHQPNADRRTAIRVYGRAVRENQNRRKFAD